MSLTKYLSYIRRFPTIGMSILKGTAKIGFYNAIVEHYHLQPATNPINDIDNIKFIRCGNRNPDKHFIVVRFNQDWVPTAGFFALLHRVLGGLYFADYFSLTPVVDNWNGCPYEEKEKINGTHNVFEYYFKPVSPFTLEEVMQSKNVSFTKDLHGDYGLLKCGAEWFLPTPKYIYELGKIYRKFIFLNDVTEKKLIHDFNDLNLSGNILGIHYRGTDYKLNCAGHPMSVSLLMYITEIKKIIKEKHFDSIFLATDDIEAITYFTENFPNVKYYTDVKRTNGNISVAFLKNNRDNDKYLTGYEVLRDMYTLSKCQGIVAGLSQVAIIARVYKSSRDEKFDIENIINPGINRTGDDWIQIFNEMQKEDNDEINQRK